MSHLADRFPFVEHVLFATGQPEDHRRSQLMADVDQLRELRLRQQRTEGRFPSPALRARLAATESALAAAKSKREEAAKRLQTAKAKDRESSEFAGGLFLARRSAKLRDPF
jgi:hypothetical protein